MEPQSSISHWNDFHQRLRGRVTPVAWQTWLEPLDAVATETTLTLEAPTEFHLQWVRDKYLSTIVDVAGTTLGEDVDVVLQAKAHEPQAPAEVAGPRGPATPGRVTPEAIGEAHLTPKYTFDNFVVGPSNRFAHAAAMAVAELPGSRYNPLFIYGDAGLGKTHLLHAVGHHAVELRPGVVVRYVSSEQFFNEFINGIRNKRMDQFKSRYRTIDVLLLDDVQFFEGKEQILEEFFHTFNTLHEAGKQLVISSDRHPKHLSTLENRLRSRFEWGLLTDIQPPDVETRLAILRSNAEFAPQQVPHDVLEFIATHVLDNIRELEGALTRVTAYAALTHQPITLPMATEILRDVVPNHANMPITTEDIIAVTAQLYQVSPLDIIGPSRKQPLARGRQVAMYLCRELTDLSLPKIGRDFGGRDHTTVMHAVDKIKGLIQSDKEIFDNVTTLSQRLRRT